MKKAAGITAVTAAALLMQMQGAAAEEEWELIWEDQFEGDSLNESKWNYDIGNGFYDGDEWIDGWGNNESQSYQQDNVTVEDGKLVIEAREEQVSDEYGEYDYTSGKIHTEGLFSQAYGKFEASIKLPEGQGFWPAFWMMPEEDIYGGWAASGEIDIMENRGSETDEVGAAIHYGDVWPHNTYSEQPYQFPEDGSTTEFNTYGIEWEPGEIRWYVNDEIYSVKDEWHTEGVDFPAPFDQEFHLILNLAVGGWYGGEPDETTEFPAQMEVDYVKVYEDANAEYETGTPPEETDEEEADEPDESEEAGPGIDPDLDWEEVGSNLVEDGSFTSTDSFGDPDNRELWSTFSMGEHDSSGGIAEFTRTEPGIQAEITQVGWAWWHMQLMQELEVDEAGVYRLSFDASSEEARTIRAELVDSGAEIMSFELDEETNTYEGYVEVEESGSFDLMFGLGRDDEEGDEELDVPYLVYLDNISFTRVEAEGHEAGEPEEDTGSAPVLDDAEEWVPAGSSIITDGSFSETENFGHPDDRSTWNVFGLGEYEDGAGLAEASVTENGVAMEVLQEGWAWWHIQLLQEVDPEAGVYELSFDASSEEARVIRAELVNSGADIIEFDIDEDTSIYEALVEVDESGNFDLMFGLGREEEEDEREVPYTVTLNNISLTPMQPAEEEEEEPSEPTDPAEQTFTDVPENHWAAGYIAQLADGMIIEGYGNDLFGPEDSVNRGQFAAMLVRAMELDTASGSHSFTDADGEFEDYIAAAAEAELVQGRPDGTFGTEETITRQDMAIMLVRAHGLQTSEDASLHYADTNAVHPSAVPSVTAATEAGLLEGRGQNRFEPTEAMTRAEAAKVVFGVMD
ncbi:S-layer homology domain-containing protein [Alkalicoccus chagannorensis]|uniref:S-layer homology domain-containing protein n=1 Tax=Alkalicoccus chagannorensis TaxID=427072 RepID=UPI000400CE1C|nr:S-layer homology domain-containing protein [Alkalicoccus chagannorensis]